MYKKVLVLAPHTDDAELGCGGYISKLIAEGSEVYCVAFSTAEKSIPAGLPKDITSKEIAVATAYLGIKSKNLYVLNYEVREFPAHRQEILEDLIKFRTNINPDLILIPNLNDIHQDHTTIAQEAVRAFKNRTILGYELPWNNLISSNTCYVKLTEEQINNKVEALKRYESQSGRVYTSEEAVVSLARIRGIQIGTEFAEMYEVIRWII